MAADIRDRPRLEHLDIVELNFIRGQGDFLFRRHYRMGLRSHIMEVLKPADVAVEKSGIIKDGLRWFPKATPLKVLRIFRTRFGNLRDAEGELGRVKIVERYLGPEYIAKSDEFLVDYTVQGGYEPLLCGLQEYVDGEILDPWGRLDRDYLRSLFRRIDSGGAKNGPRAMETWERNVRKGAERALGRIRTMILEAKLVPDLAGVGNLLLTRTGDIKLVDINNISRVSFESAIPLDDRGYPVCDKSVEALSLLEQKLLGRPIDRSVPIYRTFLDPGRMKEVRSIEREFHVSMGSSTSYFYP
jgi:hypothetical protein